MSVQLLKRKFTVEQYHKMLDSGILAEDDRVELIQGEIIEMSPIGTRHAATVRRLSSILFKKLNNQAIVDTQNPIVLGNHSEPQPDVVLLKPRLDFYQSEHPQPSDILLLVEVSDTTIQIDREVKIPLYAENAISEVCIVDLQQECIEVYRQPSSGGYQNIKTFKSNKSLSIQAFPAINIAVNEVV